MSRKGCVREGLCLEAGFVRTQITYPEIRVVNQTNPQQLAMTKLETREGDISDLKEITPLQLAMTKLNTREGDISDLTPVNLETSEADISDLIDRTRVGKT